VLFVYKAVSISICYTSSRFSEVGHFLFINLPCGKIKKNFRNGGKILWPASKRRRLFYRVTTRDYDVSQRWTAVAATI